MVQYTEIPVRQDEVVITLDSKELTCFPFVFMTGHKLVRFSERERQGLVHYVENGGLLFSDDCNHDVNGLYAKSFEAEVHRAFGGDNVLSKIPNSHPLYRAFFKFDGPPPRAEWLGRQRRARVSARRGETRPAWRDLRESGLRLRMGLRLAQQAIPCSRQHEVRGESRRLRDDVSNLGNICTAPA